MTNRQAVIINPIADPKRAGVTVLISRVYPLITGNGEISVFCGHCMTMLIKNVFPGQVQRIIIKCPMCGFYNDTRKACS